MVNRILLRTAVLVGGCAAATAIGLGISGPASADNHPVRDLLGGVVGLVEDVLPGPAAAPPTTSQAEAPKQKPHKKDRPRDWDRPRPVRKAVNVVGTVAKPVLGPGGDRTPPAAEQYAPVVDSIRDDELLPVEDAPAVTDMPLGLLGPAVAAAITPTVAAPLPDFCVDGTHALSRATGRHQSTPALSGRRQPDQAAPELRQFGPQSPPTSGPHCSFGAATPDFPSPPPPPPAHGLLAATWHPPSPTAGSIRPGDRDADGRDHQPCAPSG